MIVVYIEGVEKGVRRSVSEERSESRGCGLGFFVAATPPKILDIMRFCAYNNYGLLCSF